MRGGPGPNGGAVCRDDATDDDHWLGDNCGPDDRD
jgi:hypothetical protein